MGEEWHHKKDRQYKHQIQLGAKNLGQTPLLEMEEEVEKLYLGHIDRELDSIFVGHTLTLFITGKHARPALLKENLTVGYMDGDSAQDVWSSIQASERFPVIWRMRVVDKDVASSTVVLSRVRDTTRETDCHS
jgi:hypothetical protein